MIIIPPSSHARSKGSHPPYRGRRRKEWSCSGCPPETTKLRHGAARAGPFLASPPLVGRVRVLGACMGGRRDNKHVIVESCYSLASHILRVRPPYPNLPCTSTYTLCSQLSSSNADGRSARDQLDSSAALGYARAGNGRCHIDCACTLQSVALPSPSLSPPSFLPGCPAPAFSFLQPLPLPLPLPLLSLFLGSFNFFFYLSRTNLFTHAPTHPKTLSFCNTPFAIVAHGK